MNCILLHLFIDENNLQEHTAYGNPSQSQDKNFRKHPALYTVQVMDFHFTYGNGSNWVLCSFESHYALPIEIRARSSNNDKKKDKLMDDQAEP